MKTTEVRQVDVSGFMILPSGFTDKGFEFKQVWRENDYAIYQKTKPHTSLKHFEAIQITRHTGYCIAGNSFPASEVYPSSEMFGVTAYDCLNLSDAQKRINYMRGFDVKR